MLRLILALLLALGVLAARARADVIHLVSGDEIRGRVVEETATEVVIEVPGGEARVARADVARIERESPAAYARAKGEDMLRLGAVDAAIPLFREALELGERRAAGGLAAAERAAASRARARGDLAGAARHLAEAAKAAAANPDDAEAARATAAASASLGAARARARDLAAEGKRLADAHAGDRALPLLREAIRLDGALEAELSPALARASADEAVRIANAGDYARGAALLDEAVARDPTLRPAVAGALSTCHVAVAIERLFLNDADGALASLRSALEADPASKLARLYSGVAHEVGGDPEAAAADYRRLAGDIGDGSLAALRDAARAAAGRVPVDPAAFLGESRPAEAGPREVPLAAQAGPISVHATSASLGADVLAAAQKAAGEIAAWVGRDALAVPVAIVVLDDKGRFREVTHQGPGVAGVTIAHAWNSRGSANGSMGSGDPADRREAGGSPEAWLIYTYVGARNMVTHVVPHEMTHALLGAAIRRGALPLWLNEGLAMSSEPDAGAARTEGYRRALAAGTATPIEEIVRMRAYPQEAAQMDAYYCGAAAFTAFLLQASDREKMLDFARRAAANGVDAAFRDGFAGFASVEEAMAAFVTWVQAS